MSPAPHYSGKQCVQPRRRKLCSFFFYPWSCKLTQKSAFRDLTVPTFWIIWTPWFFICPELSSSPRGKPEQNRQDESQTYQLQILITSPVPALCPAPPCSGQPTLWQLTRLSLPSSNSSKSKEHQLLQVSSLTARSVYPQPSMAHPFPGPQPLASTCRPWGPGRRWIRPRPKSRGWSLGLATWPFLHCCCHTDLHQGWVCKQIT